MTLQVGYSKRRTLLLERWLRPVIQRIGRDGVEEPLQEKKLNAYERSLLEKEQLREAYLQKYIDEQRELLLYPGNNPKTIIIYPLTSGLGNNLGVLAEGILISMLTHRRLQSAFGRSE